METKTLTRIAMDVLSNYGLGDFDVSVGQGSTDFGYSLRIGKTLSLGLEDVKDPHNFAKFVDVMLDSMISKSPFVASIERKHELALGKKREEIDELRKSNCDEVLKSAELLKYKNYYELAKGLK